MKIKLAPIVLVSALVLPGVAAAQQCAATINSNDAMQFDVKEMTVDKSCKQFTVTLKHVGKLPVSAMGHNWILTSEQDMQPVATEGIAAGLENDYVKPDDARVIAHTDMIGGGQETAVTFDVAKLKEDEKYSFFCSFPGHWSVMKGSLKLSS